MSRPSPLVEVPADITTPEQFRAWQVAMRRQHGRFRYRNPLGRVAALRSSAELPTVELPPEVQALESAFRKAASSSRGDPASAYHEAIATLRAFDDAMFIAHGRFRRRKTLFDNADPQPEGAALRLMAEGGEELVTRGLLVSSCRICEPAANGAFPTREACEAACGGTVATDCCPENPLPETLYAHFSGSLAVWGTVALVWDGSSGWAADPPPGCSSESPQLVMGFSCNAVSGEFGITSPGIDTIFSVSAPPTSCAPPFSWSASGTAIGPCGGSFGVTIDTTP